jgi:hypothetical protein
VNEMDLPDDEQVLKARLGFTSLVRAITDDWTQRAQLAEFADWTREERACAWPIIERLEDVRIELQRMLVCLSLDLQNPPADLLNEWFGEMTGRIETTRQAYSLYVDGIDALKERMVKIVAGRARRRARLDLHYVPPEQDERLWHMEQTVYTLLRNIGTHLENPSASKRSDESWDQWLTKFRTQQEAAQKAAGELVWLRTHFVPAFNAFYRKQLSNGMDVLECYREEILRRPATLPAGEDAGIAAAHTLTSIDRPEGGLTAGLAEVLNEFTTADYWLAQSETLVEHVFMALSDCESPATFQSVIEAARTHDYHFRKHEITMDPHSRRLGIGTRFERRKRKFSSRKQIDGETFDVFHAAHGLMLETPHAEWIGYWSLEQVCQRAGLDHAATQLLTHMYARRPRQPKRQWRAIGRELGMGRSAVDAAVRRIERASSTLEALLAQPAPTITKAVAYDRAAFHEWRERRQERRGHTTT